MNDYVQILNRELAKRLKSNPNYSLRAFARSLKLDPGNLSRVLSKKSPLSRPAAYRIVSSLSLNPREQNQFIFSLEHEHSRKYRRPETKNALSFHEVDNVWYDIISEWYHYAIVELTLIQGFKPNPKWIAGQLGISEMTVKNAIERLVQVGLLRYKNKNLVKTKSHYTTGNKNQTSAALRRWQMQLLDKAIHAIEELPIEERSASSMTCAIDRDLLPEATAMIREFSRKLADFLESGKKTNVYNLSITLFPLQKTNKEMH